MSDKFAPTERTRVRRIPARGQYDRDTVYRIIDEALICHVGLVEAGQPFVIPTIPVRVGDVLYMHGARTSRLMRHAAAGQPLCVTVTLLDGLVLARSAFHHSMNYRSVVVLGSGREISDVVEKASVLSALVERVVPGRASDARMPNAKELAATIVVGVPIDEASAKVRTGPPGDEPADLDLPHWAGVIPLSLQPGVPESSPDLREGIPVPAYASAYRRGSAM